MAGVLTLGQWLGGPDNVKVESTFPSTQKTYSYDFDQSITGWTFKLDYQTVVVDTIAYTRDGEPNFADSSVIGYFPSGVVSTSSYIAVVSGSAGTVNVTHPGGLYPEANGILPDARANVPITVIGVTWTDNSSPINRNTHRWAYIQCWEPGVTPGDPTLSTATFTAISVGA
jgi:hypothetical protein